jgi:hypothetical protein
VEGWGEGGQWTGGMSAAEVGGQGNSCIVLDYLKLVSNGPNDGLSSR